MQVNRRQFLKHSLLLAAGAGLSSCRVSMHEGMRNSCVHESLAEIQQHPLWQQAWEGIDPTQVWDCHCHLVGIGDSDSGIEVNDAMQSWWHPLQHAQFSFYLNASCASQDDDSTSVDAGVIKRLLLLASDFKPGYKMMLLGFDHYHDDKGEIRPEYSAFYVSNRYAAKVAAMAPSHFEWIASIHPYRKDAIKELDWCVEHGARAVKWLPGAMGINPAASRCDEFYQRLSHHKIPLLSHTGTEYAVETPSGQTYNNPLLLRRPLKLGVRVIAAHCASMGEFIDLDVAADAEEISGYQLFKRMMNEQPYGQNLYGDVSAFVLVNRDQQVIADIIRNKDLHQRLVYGSDYPLPGIMPLINTGKFVDWEWLTEAQALLLEQVRRSNSLLYDFLLKRMLKVDGVQLAPQVFHSRRVFTGSLNA